MLRNNLDFVKIWNRVFSATDNLVQAWQTTCPTSLGRRRRSKHVWPVITSQQANAVALAKSKILPTFWTRFYKGPLFHLFHWVISWQLRPKETTYLSKRLTWQETQIMGRMLKSVIQNNLWKRIPYPFPTCALTLFQDEAAQSQIIACSRMSNAETKSYLFISHLGTLQI